MGTVTIPAGFVSPLRHRHGAGAWRPDDRAEREPARPAARPGRRGPRSFGGDGSHHRRRSRTGSGGSRSATRSRRGSTRGSVDALRGVALRAGHPADPVPLPDGRRSAVGGADQAQDSQFSIPAGKSSITVPVPVIPDAVAEPNELHDDLVGATGAVIERCRPWRSARSSTTTDVADRQPRELRRELGAGRACRSRSNNPNGTS